MTGSLNVARRFCGPPDSGNGGYVCGFIAGFVEGAAEVTLRLPPPLGSGANTAHPQLKAAL
jgi:hypothetical protein